MPRRDLADRYARGGADRKGKRRVTRPNVPAASARPPVAEPAEVADGEVVETVVARPASPARPAAQPARPPSSFAARRAQNIAGAQRPRAGGVRTDYEAVRHDLRRIGVLAGGIFVVLIALSFVLH